MLGGELFSHFLNVMLLTLLVSGITETAFYTRLPGTLSIIWMFTIALGAYHVVERRRINAALWAGPGQAEEGVALTGSVSADEASRNVIQPGRKGLSESLAG